MLIIMIFMFRDYTLIRKEVVLDATDILIFIFFTALSWMGIFMLICIFWDDIKSKPLIKIKLKNKNS